MPPKKLKTRHSGGKCFGPSAELPDDGDLFTMKDVLAACERELEISPNSSHSSIAEKIAPKIVAKWKENNPELVLIADKSIKTKIIRSMTTAEDIRLKKLTKKQKDIFFQKLDKLFDLLVCQCPIDDCPVGRRPVLEFMLTVCVKDPTGFHLLSLSLLETRGQKWVTGVK